MPGIVLVQGTWQFIKLAWSLPSLSLTRCTTTRALVTLKRQLVEVNLIELVSRNELEVRGKIRFKHYAFK